MTIKTTIRYWALRAALVLLGLLPIVGTEVLLRYSSPEKKVVSLDPYLDCSQLSPLFVNEGNKLRIPEERMRLFAAAEFPTQKAINTQRIFCVGGSTTQGEPYKPATAFPMWLERNLRLIAPTYNWEVINCGGLSYASYRMLPIVLEVLQYSPDLIVIDCGHNEFLEDRELSGWKNTPSAVRGMLGLLHSSRLVRLVADPMESTANFHRGAISKTRLQREVNALLDDHGGLEKYHRDSLNSDAVVASMEWNLSRILEACKESEVPVILLVPTTNVLNCPPFKSETNRNLSVAVTKAVESHWNRCQQLRNELKNAQESDRSILKSEIERELEQLLLLDPQDARSLYLLGRLKLDSNQIEEAHELLVRAKDCDVCPLRATTSIQESIRALAVEQNAWIVDVDDLFQSVSKDRLVGDQWLVDHVHPRIEGHQLLGERLADYLVERSWVVPEKEDWKTKRHVDYREHLQGLGEDYFLRGKQRLEGLMLWTQGRAKKNLIGNEAQP